MTAAAARLAPVVAVAGEGGGGSGRRRRDGTRRSTPRCGGSASSPASGDRSTTESTVATAPERDMAEISRPIRKAEAISSTAAIQPLRTPVNALPDFAGPPGPSETILTQDRGRSGRDVNRTGGGPGN